jgi:hypothetical protein
VIAALLMLQLAIGLQWQAAHAAAALPEPQKNAMKAGHCPGHQSSDSRSVEGRGSGATSGAPSSHGNSGDKHDCCRSVGCQCDYAQNPGVLDLPRAGAVFSTLLLQPMFAARPAVARTNKLFRPPIARAPGAVGALCAVRAPMSPV